LIYKCLENIPRFEALIIELDPIKLKLRKDEIRIDHAIDSHALKVQNIICRKNITIEEKDTSVLEWQGMADTEAIKLEMENHPDEIVLHSPSIKRYMYSEDIKTENILSNMWQIS
jgi:hypothetical protein